MNDYLASRRRLLLDMHIPDWDDEFLARYDPAELARLYQLAGAGGALVYCKSHVGLSYWPSPVGGVHRAARDRDLVGETKAALEAAGIGVAAYHSVIFDNWAAEEHPAWRVVPATRELGYEWALLGPRYGTLCPNQRAYVEYEKQQITALLDRFDFETLWIDMAFWTAICVCDACADRFRFEHGLAIPRHIDWRSADWTTFQSARERWIAGFTEELLATARAVRPGISVTHNLAPGLRDWSRGQRSEDARLDDFVAGDLYGGFDEQVFVLGLMRALRRGVRAEFMTTRTKNLFNHSNTKSQHEMLTQAYAAVAADTAFLFIDAVEPSGQLNELIYERIGMVFATTSIFDSELGGNEITDVAVYYSDDSRIDEAENGNPRGAPHGAGGSRHQEAVMGAVRALRRGHIPFSVVTRLDNDRLGEFTVVVVPDARRISRDDVAALRSYVAHGGRLYASGRTSLLLSDGTAPSDFALADVFGCHLVGVETGLVVYVRPETPDLRDAAQPEAYLPIGQRHISSAGSGTPLDLPRVRATDRARVLARLTLPYGYPADGSLGSHDFASIHSSPPWEDTEFPSIVVHDFGAGRAVYSSAALEAEGSPEHEESFRRLLRTELGLAPRLTARAHPDVWVTGFEQTQRNRIVVSALRLVEEPPESLLLVTLCQRIPDGQALSGARDVGSGRPCLWRMVGDVAEIEVRLELFAMVVVELMGTGSSPQR
ncbi:MAG: alpha-amylase family protein [Terrimesophilobacter sp.]